MKFETLYTADKKRSARFATHNTEPTMTEQSHANETDINVIVGKFLPTGQLPQVQTPAKYGDFTQVTDFRSAVEAINTAQDMFMELPAKIREQFGNDPGAFVDFATDSKNIDKLIEMGLAEKPPEAYYHNPAATPEYSDEGESWRSRPNSSESDSPQREQRSTDNRPSSTTPSQNSNTRNEQNSRSSSAQSPRPSNDSGRR